MATEKEYVYEFCYTSCIYESAPATISIHKTEKGAQIAMEFHKNEAKKEFDEMYSKSNDFNIVFGEHESWFVNKTEIYE